MADMLPLDNEVATDLLKAIRLAKLLGGQQDPEARERNRQIKAIQNTPGITEEEKNRAILAIQAPDAYTAIENVRKQARENQGKTVDIGGQTFTGESLFRQTQEAGHGAQRGLEIVGEKFPEYAQKTGEELGLVPKPEASTEDESDKRYRWLTEGTPLQKKIAKIYFGLSPRAGQEPDPEDQTRKLVDLMTKIEDQAFQKFKTLYPINPAGQYVDPTTGETLPSGSAQKFVDAEVKRRFENLGLSEEELKKIKGVLDISQ